MKPLYYPVKPLHVNQVFGNPDPVYTAMGLQGHNGIDLMAYHGQPVYASHDGFAYYEIDAQGGHGVVIRSKDTIDFNGQQVYYKTIYWHFCNEKLEPQFTSPIKVTDVNSGGQVVRAGDLIGYADNTGTSSGDHLHFGLKPVTPNESNINGSLVNLAPDNGYKGAIDPQPYLNGLFAEDIVQKYQFTRNLGLWSIGQDVLKLQQILVQGKYGNFVPTGLYGGKTQMAVKVFQLDHKIEMTGFVGPLTRAALNS